MSRFFMVHCVYSAFLEETSNALHVWIKIVC